MTFIALRRRFKRDSKTSIKLDNFKYTKDIQIYLKSSSLPAIYITYRSTDISIFISKKLYKLLTRAELEAILYHELGHYHHRYLSLFGDIIIKSVVITLPIVTYNFYNITDSIFLTYLMFILYNFISLFLYSNFRKIVELLADRHSIKYTSKQRFVKALKKAAKAFIKEEPPNIVYNLFFEFHPSVNVRCIICYL